MKLAIRRAGRWTVTALAALAFMGIGAGCAIHAQAPIKEVAYDFSDSDFYDRAYAPSPAYETSFAGHGAPLRAPAHARVMAPHAPSSAAAEAGLVAEPVPAESLGVVVAPPAGGQLLRGMVAPTIVDAPGLTPKLDPSR